MNLDLEARPAPGGDGAVIPSLPMKGRAFLKLFAGLIFLLVSLQIAAAQELKREEITSAYIYNFAKNIEWTDENRFREYHFLIISDDKEMNRELSKLSASKRLNGKPIRITLSESVVIPRDIELVYITRGLNDLAGPVFRRIEGQNVLLITDGLEDKRIAMINLVGTKDNRIKFEINKANILNQGLKLRPDMVLLGGTEIDVAKLYKESQDSLRIKERKLTALRRHFDSLNLQIESAHKEISKQNLLITQQNQDIQEKKNRLERQQDQLDRQQTDLGSQRIQLAKQRDSLAQQNGLLLKSQGVLRRQQIEIENGKAVLSNQQEEIDRQKESILRQKTVLEEQDVIIAAQKKVQRLLILIIILAFGLSYTVYRSYKSKKLSNRRLQVQTDKLQETLGHLEYERDKAQQYLDIAGVIFVAIDTDRRITLINQKGCQVLGLSMDEIIGKDWFASFIPESARQGQIQAFRRLFTGGAGPAEYGESTVLTHGNGERLIAWHNVPLKDENGAVVGTLSSGEDITEKKRAEMQIEDLNRDLTERAAALEAANKELEAFSYSVSHDLRAPLRSIDGFSQAIIEDYGERIDARGKDYLRRVRSAAQRMAQLIDDMLNLSRVTRGEMDLREIDLSGMAEDISEKLRKLHPDRKIGISIQAGIKTVGDERLIRIALENLFENAFKYTSKHPEAHIEFGSREIDRKKVCFIKDDGAGFDMKYANKLFGAFQRLHTDQEFPGTGVGLATVQRIIRRHGGEIWAESEVGKGATFYCSLPVKEYRNVR